MIELNLPKDILDKAIIYGGNEFGWKISDIIDVVGCARKVNLGILGGQISYICPDGTCELYWVNFDTTEKKENESWDQYVNRSCDEFISGFNNLIFTTDIRKEAINSFKFLEDKYSHGIDIDKYLYFLLYFIEYDGKGSC